MTDPTSMKAVVTFFLTLSLGLLAGCHKSDENDPVDVPTSTNHIVSTDTLVLRGKVTKKLTLTPQTDTDWSYELLCPYFDWCSALPSSGYFKQGQTGSITVTPDYEMLNSEDIFENVLMISSTFGMDKVALIGSPNAQIRQFVSDVVYFPSGKDNMQVAITKFVEEPMNYSVVSSSSHVTLTSAEGEMTEKQVKAYFSVHVDRNALLSSHTRPELYVSIDGTIDTVSLDIERAMRLSSSVIDAEYAKSADVLVYVADDATLGIYHPDSEVIDVIQLSYPPLSVSVSQDGAKAVVGHADHATLVDLQAKRILTENEILRSADDIVLGDNGWAYAFKKSVNGEYIYCFDASVPNSSGFSHTGHCGFGNTKAKVHPSGKYLYGAINGLSSMTIEKYDIQSGVADYLYESSLGNLGGDLWFAEDGSKVYTKSGKVLKISENQELDMLYNGTVVLGESVYPTRYAWIDQLECTKSLFLLWEDGFYTEENKPYVYEVNSANLIFRRKYPLDKIMTYSNYGDFDLSDPNPKFVFANSNGEEMYVLSSVIQAGSNATYLQIIPIEGKKME